MTLRELVPLYLQSKQNSWAPTTLKSETARLNKLVEVCDGKVVADQWAAVAGVYGDYARVTAWTRLAALWRWALDRGLAQGTNEHARFREDNARLFRNAYRRQPARVEYAELRRAVMALPIGQVRDKLIQLLDNGLRVAESRTHADGHVTGKGGKVRETIHRDGPARHAGYAAVRAACKELGVKPHDLRKAFATELYRKGLREVEICEVMGWSDFATAKAYIKPHTFDEMRKRITL